MENKKTNRKKTGTSVAKKLYPSPSLLVREFHETYGQPIRTEPVYDIPELIMRSKLILEEASEYWEADRANDLVEMADALADLVYVCYGAALTHGINLDVSFGGKPVSPADLLKTIHKKNGQKIRNSPTLAVLARKRIASGLNKSAVAYSTYVQNTEKSEGDVDQLRRILTTLVSSAYFAAFSLGIDLDHILEEVQRSNMSKLGEDGRPIYREDGKVLKGPNFFNPDLTKILVEQGWKQPKTA